jgi:hypothetical protein
MLLLQHEQLKDSKSRAVEQLDSAREVNKGASQVIADLEGEINNLGQDKLGLELKQVKLEKEVDTLKRKRRSTPSPPPAKSAPTYAHTSDFKEERKGVPSSDGIHSLSFLSSPT